MKRNAVHAISIFILMIAVSFFIFITSGTAEASVSLSSTEGAKNVAHKIRVGQIDFPDFYVNDKRGPIGGYGFEYLEEIASYTGWSLEYVPVTFERGTEMLESGELDLLAPAVMNPEMQRRFEYSDKEIGLNYSVLCVETEDTRTAYNDFEVINGMKVGILKDASINDTLNIFAENNNFEINPIYFLSQTALLKALHEGKVDAILTSSLEHRPTERIIAKFAPNPYYIITAKGNTSIMGPLNKALSSIKENNPYFDYDLQRKYYDWDEYSVPIFTEEEKRFIKNSGVLKTVYDPAWAPFEYYDTESETFAGINADIFQLISDMTGLRFSYIRTNSYTEALQKITNYEASILTAIDHDTQWANQHNLLLTDTYFTSSIVMVKNAGVSNLDKATTALAQDYLAASEYIRKSNPFANIIYLKTPLECFEAVNSGKADITYANSYVAEKLMENPKLNKLEIVETVNLSDELSIGVSDSMSPILLSILNKSIHSISDAQLNRIVFQHTINDNPQINLEYLIYKDPRFLILFLIILFLVTTATLTVIIRIKNNHNKEIKKVAYTDSVTGTGNYYKFKEDAASLLENAKNKSYAIIYIDINKFSYINDTFGYQAGDLILSEVAKELESLTRDTECSARISADNFVCLLEYEGEESLVKRGLAFQRQCNKRLSRIHKRFRVKFTSAVYIVSRGESDIASLVGKADIAHKTIGGSQKNPIVFYDNNIQNEFLRKKKLESAMIPALKNKEFKVYLQPKFNLLDNSIIGAEALIRWQHPLEGLIFPQQFISLFESNGFILELDFYVYDSVCRLLRKWLDAGFDVMPVSVNVSKAHMTNPQFVLQLKALTDQHHIPPKLLELELTESIFLHDAHELMQMIRDLKALGFSISIDDFGSGYSSFSLLKDLIVDELKIDKDFFRRDGMTVKDRIIVNGIINIANALSLRIISEGVETKEQVDFLLQSGCHVAQGYFFSKPMPEEEFEKLAGFHSISE